MSLEDEVRRAGRAKEILGNELFKEAVTEIEGALKDARLNSSIKDTEMREKLWAQEVALHSIIRNLESVIDTGQLAEEQIRQASILDKAKKIFRVT